MFRLLIDTMIEGALVGGEHCGQQLVEQVSKSWLSAAKVKGLSKSIESKECRHHPT